MNTTKPAQIQGRRFARRRWVVLADETHPDTGTFVVFGPFDTVDAANAYLDAMHDTWGGGSIHMLAGIREGREPR